MIVSITDAPIDEAALRRDLIGPRKDIGALVSFSGLVREMTGKAGEVFTLEHYPGMAERRLEEIAGEAMARFDLVDIAIAHRVGEMEPGDVIVSVIAAARHRKAAFQAAEFAMDNLKSRAPFWKKEAGGEWVAPRASDEEELARWHEGEGR